MPGATEIVNAGVPRVLVHDGGFEGFLSAVHDAFALQLRVERVEPTTRHVAGLFETVREVATDRDHARRVLEGIRVRGGNELVSMVRAALLSELPGIETAVWRVLKGLFATPRPGGADPGPPANAPGRKAWRNVLDPDMLATCDAARKTRHEAHRFRGFVRFSKAPDGSHFAVIAPDHDILELLAPHFAARFPNMDWSIFDERRGRCLTWRDGEAAMLEVERSLLPKEPTGVARAAASGEERFLELWRAYCRATNIDERANPKLLRRNLPTKYWRYLPERQGS